MFAYDYPLLDVVLSMLWFFLFFMWIWIAVMVVVDIFRSDDMGGWSKALWFVFVVFLPFLGIFIYLVARGDRMHERQASDAARSQQEFQAYVQQAAGAADVPGQLQKLAELRDSGVISDQEFQSQKAKLLA